MACGQLRAYLLHLLLGDGGSLFTKAVADIARDGGDLSIIELPAKCRHRRTGRLLVRRNALGAL